MKKKYYSTIVLLFFATPLICFQSCKKNSNASNTNTNPKSKVTVYTNGNDPRLAQIETTNQRFLFFGKRNSDGSPSHLTGYSVYSLTDLTQFDLLTYDSLGRFSTLLLRTGERMRVDYLLNDSMQITVGGKDSVIKQVTTLRVSAYNEASKIAQSMKTESINAHDVANRNQSINGMDKNVNVKVTKLNTSNQMEDDVTNHEAGVLVNIYGGIYKNYTIPADYDASRGVYSMPLTAAGFEFDADNAYTRTLDFIKNTVNDVCNNDIQQIESIVDHVCEVAVIPSPVQAEAAILCGSSKTIIYLCRINDVADALSTAQGALGKIDPNGLPISTDATVIVESNHTLYGRKNSAEISVKQILSKTGNYDIKITYEYFKKIGPALLTTIAPSSITQTTAVSGGNITNDGGSPITTRGVVWGTSSNPTIINNNLTNDGAGIESFTSLISKLTPGQTYHIRAYAANIVGTAYGNDISFTTTGVDTTSLRIISPVDSININFPRYTPVVWNSIPSASYYHLEIAFLNNNSYNPTVWVDWTYYTIAKDTTVTFQGAGMGLERYRIVAFKDTTTIASSAWRYVNYLN